MTATESELAGAAAGVSACQRKRLGLDGGGGGACCWITCRARGAQEEELWSFLSRRPKLLVSLLPSKAGEGSEGLRVGYTSPNKKFLPRKPGLMLS